MTQSYRRPPIVEAVVEFRLQTQLPRNDLEKIRDRLDYPFVDEENHIQFRIGQSEADFSIKGSFNGFKLNSKDLADLVFVRSNSLAVSRLAPYEGWDSFKENALKCWSVWHQVIGHQKLARLGVRYVNRLDIPIDGTGSIHEEEYLHVSPRAPLELIPKMNSYAMQLTAPLSSDDCNLNLNSGTVISPLVNHVALSLDIDISREKNLPGQENELWDLLEKMRGHKNRIFEGVITDKSRELFSK